MIGKRVRSLPFIFANDKYTLSISKLNIPVREMADELLAHYTPEQLRMHFMSLGLSAKSVGFKPQVYMSQEEKTGIDMVLKKEIFLQMYITD